jgi:hypothetical protein
MDHARGSALAVMAAVAATGIAGCGGARQDAKEPSGQFKVAVTKASFPSKQSLSQPTTLRIDVRNADKRTLPDVAVTVETRPKGGAAPLAFGTADAGDARLADTGKPVWVLDREPKGGESAYTNTWALGEMFPGETKTFTWKLLPVQAGDYTVDYRVSPGLNGKAKVARGQRSHGAFKVSISNQPVPARVDDNGKVVRGEEAGGGSSSSSGQ